MRGSLIAVAFFVAGVLCGRLDVLPLWLVGGHLSTAALCLLMFCVAFGLGRDPSALGRAVRLNPRLALLPLATIAGTTAGSLVLSAFGRWTTADWCAAGSGMGYYSLSSILLTEYRGAELGTLALMTNIVRELLALLAAPWWARWFGRLAPIAVAGATSMDTALPVCTRYAGREYAPLAVYHGFVADASVFFLVTLFAG